MQLRCNIAAAAPLLLFHLAIKISDITLFEKYQKSLGNWNIEKTRQNTENKQTLEMTGKIEIEEKIKKLVQPLKINKLLDLSWVEKW